MSTTAYPGTHPTFKIRYRRKAGEVGGIKVLYHTNKRRTYSWRGSYGNTLKGLPNDLEFMAVERGGNSRIIFGTPNRTKPVEEVTT